MSGAMDDFLRDHHDAIIAAVQARMKGDETMGRVAEQRELSESGLSGQVLGFTLEAIRSDLTIGSPVAMQQGLRWLASLGAGQGLPIDGPALTRLLDDVSGEVEARLDSDALRTEYAAYREQLGPMIADAFPH